MKRILREWRSWLLLIVMVILFAWFLSYVTGCSQPRPPMPAAGGGNMTPWEEVRGFFTGGSSDPSVQGQSPAAQRSLWPFTMLGFSFMAGGGLWWLLTGNRKALALGVALALTPYALWFVISRLAPAIDWVVIPLSIAAGLAGIAVMVWLIGRKMGWIDASRTAMREVELLKESGKGCEACALEKMAGKPMREIMHSHSKKEPVT